MPDVVVILFVVIGHKSQCTGDKCVLPVKVGVKIDYRVKFFHRQCLSQHAFGVVPRFQGEGIVEEDKCDEETHGVVEDGTGRSNGSSEVKEGQAGETFVFLLIGEFGFLVGE